jgi:hypothetical protein
LKKEEIKLPNEYPYSQTVSNIWIAADPFYEEERIIKSFGTNLISKGIFPIHLVLKNLSTEESFFFEKKNCKLFIKNPTNSDIEKKQNLVKQSDPTFSVAKDTSNTLSAALPVLIISPVIGIFLFEDIRRTSDKIIRNLKTNELIDRTLFPGESLSGFLYISIIEQDSVKNIGSLRVILKSLIDDNLITIDTILNKD